MATARYWRIYITANNGDSYTAISELEFRATSGGSDLTWPAMGTNESSAYSGWGAFKAVNNNTGAASESWVTSGGSPPHWASFDFGADVSPVELVLWGEPGLPNRSPKDFQVQFSDDNSTWETLISFVNITGWTDAPRTFLLVNYDISGVVLDSDGSPASRVVRAYRRDTGAFLGSDTSDGDTGAYIISCGTYSGEVQVVCLDDDAGTLENDLIHRAYPV